MSKVSHISEPPSMEHLISEQNIKVLKYEESVKATAKGGGRKREYFIGL
jgi:hypothetical protein